jgi:hypothetical protein
VKLPPLPAQFDKPRMTADRAALLVGDVFRGSRVALSVHLRDCSTELGLLRSAQHDALDVAVDQVVIIILFKDLGSRMTKDAIPLLVGECAWKRRGSATHVGLAFLRLLGGLTVGLVSRPASERVMCDRNLVPCILSRLLQCLVAGTVPHRLGRVDLHAVGCLCDMPNERLP